MLDLDTVNDNARRMMGAVAAAHADIEITLLEQLSQNLGPNLFDDPTGFGSVHRVQSVRVVQQRLLGELKAHLEDRLYRLRGHRSRSAHLDQKKADEGR